MAQARRQEGKGAKGDQDGEPPNPDDAALHLHGRGVRLAGLWRLAGTELEVDGAAHRLARPQEAIRARLGAGNFVEVEEDLGAVYQVAQELLGDAGAALARDRLLELFELLLHEVMDGDARAIEGALARRAEDQVNRVEASLGGLALVRTQVVRQS